MKCDRGCVIGDADRKIDRKTCMKTKNIVEHGRKEIETGVTEKDNKENGALSFQQYLFYVAIANVLVNMS